MVDGDVECNIQRRSFFSFWCFREAAGYSERLREVMAQVLDKLCAF